MVPDEDAGANTQFCAVPALEKSLALNPVTAFENETVNVDALEERGPAGTVVNDAVGAD